MLRVAMKPLLTAAATLATAVAVVANPVLPRLPDITIPAMFPAGAHGLAATPVPGVAGAAGIPATRVITDIAANPNRGAAVVAGAAITAAAMSPPPGREITAALVRAAQARSLPVAAARTAFRQQAVRVSPATAAVGDPAGSMAPFGSAPRSAAALVHPVPQPVAAVHVPPPPMAAVRVPPVHEDPAQASTAQPATVRPDPASPRNRH